jgi:hypothetical protein
MVRFCFASRAALLAAPKEGLPRAPFRFGGPAQNSNKRTN